MLEIHKNGPPPPKLQFTHSLLPSYIDPQHVSTKKKPFSTFNAQPFSHTLDLTLPAEIYDLVRARLEDDSAHATGRLLYARVHMKLEELLQGDFFTKYVKMGNIAMLSEGRPNVDNIFSLYEGVLRLELDRPTYEKCGLQGRPIEDGGRKHQKGRWVVEFDLRAASMVHGKKGFGRLEWAAKIVLNASLTWLFYNFSPTSRESLPEGREPISVHQPFVKNIMPTMQRSQETSAPALTLKDLPRIYNEPEYEEERAMALLEWLQLISLGSPRVDARDQIDSFLSRYEVPDLGTGLETRDMVSVRWRGFIPPHFVKEVFLAVRQDGMKIRKEDHDGEGGTANKEDRRWFALSAAGFQDEGYTVMQWAGRDTLTWESL